MHYVFLAYLILTVVLSAYICWRWASTSLLNFSIKTSYFIIAVGGMILIYHRFILNLPL